MTIDDDRYGVDLLLAPSGEGVRDARVSGFGDLVVVDGADAGIQALTLRLLVRRGELAALGWPDYGSRLHELVGEPDLPRTQLLLAQYAREAVADDWRVEEVTEVTVTTSRVDPRVSRSEARIDLSVLLAGRPQPAQFAVAVPLERS
jgi:phage gp46-like protein